MATNQSLLTKSIEKIKKSAEHLGVKIERHERRMRRLQENKSHQLDVVTKLTAWQPYVESEDKLDFLLETITRGNKSEENRAKRILVSAIESFKQGKCSAEELLEILEGITAHKDIYG